MNNNVAPNEVAFHCKSQTHNRRIRCLVLNDFLKLSIEYKFEIIVRLRLKKIKNPWHIFCEFLHAAGGLAKGAYYWDTPFIPGNVIGCFSI